MHDHDKILDEDVGTLASPNLVSFRLINIKHKLSLESDEKRWLSRKEIGRPALIFCFSIKAAWSHLPKT